MVGRATNPTCLSKSGPTGRTSSRQLSFVFLSLWSSTKAGFATNDAPRGTKANRSYEPREHRAPTVQPPQAADPAIPLCLHITSVARGRCCGAFGVKGKRPPKFRVFSGRCPECGSDDVHLDLRATENLKRVPLTALSSSIMPGMGTQVRMRCRKCRARFLG